MRELPPEVSRLMAIALWADHNVQANSLNEKWSLAYMMIYRMEKAANDSGTGRNFPREKLAKQFAECFRGQTPQSKVANARTAINRAIHEYNAYKARNPYDLCGFDDFLKRYNLQRQDPVPFSKAIQIITAQDNSQHLARARKKFDELILRITQAPRETIDPDSIQIQRPLMHMHLETEDDERPSGKFYDSTTPKDYPKADEVIPDDFFFHAKDVWELWCKASKLKIARPRRKFF